MEKDLVIKRVFNAPLRHVWNAWIDPDQVKEWWAPEHFTTPVARIDFHEEGVSLLSMRAPKEMGGKDIYNTWTYTRIEPMQNIEYIFDFADEHGNRLTPVEVGMPADFPQHQHHKITFKYLDDNKTEMTFTQYDWGESEMRPMTEKGLSQCMDKMAHMLEAQ